MNEPKKPWLFLKRLDNWNPLRAVRPLLVDEDESTFWSADDRRQRPDRWV